MRSLLLLPGSKSSKPEMTSQGVLAVWMRGFSTTIIQSKTLYTKGMHKDNGRLEVLSPCFERLRTNDQMVPKLLHVMRFSLVDVGPSVSHDTKEFVAFPWLQMCKWFSDQNPVAKEFFDKVIANTHTKHNLPSRVSKRLMLTADKCKQRNASLSESMEAFFKQSGAISKVDRGFFSKPQGQWEDLKSQMLGFFDEFVALAGDDESNSDVGFIKALFAEYGQQESSQEAVQEQRSAVK
jgi:hypothetical protein